MYLGSRLFIFLLSLLGSVLPAQSATSEAPPDSRAATITFTFDFPGSTPDHYSLAVESSGQASYISVPNPKGNTADDSSDDFHSSSASDPPFRYQFTVSQPTRAHIFDLAARANYFEGNLNYSKGKIASTGAKTLAYHDAQRKTQASFNYTTNQPARELVSLFQNISATLEFGRRLEFEHRYQKLALDEELKRMEGMAKENSVAEIQAITPILKQIVDDPSVVNVSRARAERLLGIGEGNARK